MRYGYPRVKDRELREHEVAVKNEVSDFISDFESYSFEEIVESLDFLTPFGELEDGAMKKQTFRRVLLLAILSRRRLENENSTFIDGFRMSANPLVSVKQLIAKLCDRFVNNPSQLKREILALKELRQTLQVDNIHDEDLIRYVKKG